MSKLALLTTLKGKIIAGVLAGTVVVGGATGVILAVNSNAYHTISVEEVLGDVNATGAKKNGQLMQGEHLVAGDYVKVATAAGLTMCADQTKFFYADEETNFRVDVADSKKTKNIKFFMDSGSTLHELTEKLGEGDTYEVDTPNSTMSVRGTKFRVTVYKRSDGMVYTLTEVDSGTVLVRLKTEDGTYTGVEESFEAGESALIRGNETISEFVPGNYKGETWILDYPNLPEPSVERLIELLDDGSLIPADFEHEHVLTDWEVTKEPACETEGTRIKKCTLCGRVVETESIEATGHNYGDWIVDVEPGCETEGSRVKKCENCGKISESEVIKATGHKKSEEWTVTVEPGCDTKGTRARLCEYCGKEMETKTIKAAGHKYSEWKNTKEATCTERGAKERVCERCGKVDSSATSALGHDWQTLSQQNATCTAAGHKEEKCSRCGETKTQDSPALGHSYTLVETMTQPTCVSLGVGRYECSRCHNDYEGDIPTNPDRHIWSTYHEQQVPDPDNPDQMITGWVRTCTEECGAREVIFFNPYN